MPNKYPVAERPNPASAAKVVECSHCRAPIAVSRWERLNGFLVECPHCHGYHGKRWSIRAVALASIFVSALSFFFTMRPIRAVIAIIVWVAVVYFLLPRTEYASDLVQALAFGAVILSPLLINMTLLVRHHVDLDRHPVATRAF